MEEYARMVLGLKQVLCYLEESATHSTDFAPEAERAKALIEAAERRNGEEILELLERPMPDHYGGSGWQYVVSVARDLAMSLGARMRE